MCGKQAEQISTNRERGGDREMCAELCSVFTWFTHSPFLFSFSVLYNFKNLFVIMNWAQSRKGALYKPANYFRKTRSFLSIKSFTFLGLAKSLTFGLIICFVLHGL